MHRDLVPLGRAFGVATVGADEVSAEKRAQVCAPCSKRIAENLVGVAGQMRGEGLSGELFQVAQALILCGLPYQATDKTRITRQARLGDGSRLKVTFSSSLDVGLPYGCDRSVLHFLLDRAVKSRSRFVNWKTASEFLTAMGMQHGGKNRRDLRDRFLRIRALTIGVERSGPTSDTQIMPIIRRSRLPQSILAEAAQTAPSTISADELGLEIDPLFFEELVAHPVPVPVEILRATRSKPQLQDMMLFLYWRAYAAASPSVIPWSDLREQLWQDDSNPRRISSRFNTAIGALRLLWPELSAEARKQGLYVAPPRGMRYLKGREAPRRTIGL